MSVFDFITLFLTLGMIIFWGVYKTRSQKGLDGFLKGKEMSWATIGLSVMATQASAITFLSTPGQGYASGMEFVQNYFGLPLAMIAVCTVFIPLYHRHKVFSAYQLLEDRFDKRSRYLGSFLFLLQRGLAAGITLYAPSIILTQVMGWNFNVVLLGAGIAVIFYTISGGTQAVYVTHRHQMTVIFAGMIFVFGLVVFKLNQFSSFSESLHIAGALGKMTIVDYSLDPGKKYTIWTGLIGGFFLALSYFGTDQSQVQRYLGGRSTAQSKIGMIFNALLKVPMQFMILLLGVLVFVFYLWNSPPATFFPVNLEDGDPRVLEVQQAHSEQKVAAQNFVEALRAEDATARVESREQLKQAHEDYLKKQQSFVTDVKAEYGFEKAKESDYVFLNFIRTQLPIGMVGLLIAVIISAAMSSTASELNALSTISTVDFYQNLFVKHADKKHYIMASRLFTAGWGGVAIIFAFFIKSQNNLIESVNIIGSLFYGSVLGLFLTAFFFHWIRGTAVFLGTIAAQTVVLISYSLGNGSIGYLWYNFIGCGLVLIFSSLFQLFLKKDSPAKRL